MKKIIIVLLLLCSNAYAELHGKTVETLANAIFVVEGGKKTKYPYGIKSIATHGNKARARKICINTIQNTHNRWLNDNKPYDFLSYLADTYCPKQTDKLGNQRWKTNIRKIVGTLAL